MKRLIFIILITGALAGCSLFHTHKIEVTQGNVITEEETSELYKGMSEAEVHSYLGTPLLVNIFTPDRIEYIYTYDDGYGYRFKRRLTLLFRNGRLTEIIRS